MTLDIGRNSRQEAMAERSRRRCVAQNVVGYSADDSLAWLGDDRTFFGDSSDESLGGTSDDDQSDDAATDATLRDEPSDAKENFDEAPVPPPSEPLAASGPGKRKHSAPEPAVTTLEDVNARVQRGCKCSGKNCFKDVSPDILLTLRNSTCTLTKDQCFVSGKLDVLRRRGCVSHHGRAAERQQRRARSRTTYSYDVDDTDVCKVVFTYAHNISEWTLKTLQANLAQDIVSPPRHGSEGTMPWNALPADEIEEVKMFIRNYAIVNGLPQPAAPRGHNKQAPTNLPCVTTKQVHAEYSKAGGKVAYSTFAKLRSKPSTGSSPSHPHHLARSPSLNPQPWVTAWLTS